MSDYKIRCLEPSAGFTQGKVYSVHNEGLVDDDGDLRPANRWVGSGCFETVKESKMFTKDDLKVGYVLEFNNDPNHLAVVIPNADGEICISGPKDWFPLESVPNDLDYMGSTATKVFGRSHANSRAYKLSTESRDLLWERNAVKEISVAEAEKALTEKFGQNVRIRVGE